MKVKLPKNVCESIEEFRRCEESNANIVACLFNGADSKAAFTLRKFSKDEINFEDLLSGLINGYEPIEEDITVTINPYKQKVIQTYYALMKGQNHECEHRCDAVLHVLNTFGIKLEGVNTQ